MNVAVFGGSFDPPHTGHVLAVEYVAGSPEIDRVLVVPVFRHAFGKVSAPFEDRVTMATLAMQGLHGVEVSTVERTLPEPTRTLHTLRALKDAHPDWSLRLVIGSDVLSETDAWLAFDDVKKLAPLFLLGRRGSPHPDAPEAFLPEVSSTELRARLRSRTGTAASDPWLAERVPGSVLSYIDDRGLYRS